MKRKTDIVSRQYCSSCRRMSIKTLGAGIIIFLGVLSPGHIMCSLLPNTAYAMRTEKVIKAPVIRQFPELPTGCEAASTTMLLKWAGINVSKEEVARALPRGSVPICKNGMLSGDNPNDVFVGSPFSRYGYGVYHKPIAGVIEKYMPGRSWDLTDSSFDRILRVIDSKRPVIVWCTIGNGRPKVTKVWYDKRGNKVIWRIPQHAVLLVGYNESQVIVNDPWQGKICRYPMSAFREYWEIMGRQAVTIK